MSVMGLELFLDTSTDRGLIALLSNDHPLEERLVPAGPLSSPSLFPAIQDLLQTHGVRLRDIERFTAGIGPGSFTGIRVAVSIQQSLGFSFRKPWYGVGSLNLWVPSTPGPFVAMVDARSGGIYCQAGEWTTDSFIIRSTASRLSVEDAQLLVENYGGRIATPTPVQLRQRLNSRYTIEEVTPSLQKTFRFLILEECPSLLYASSPTLCPR